MRTKQEVIEDLSLLLRLKEWPIHKKCYKKAIRLLEEMPDEVFEARIGRCQFRDIDGIGFAIERQIIQCAEEFGCIEVEHLKLVSIRKEAACVKGVER